MCQVFDFGSWLNRRFRHAKAYYKITAEREYPQYAHLADLKNLLLQSLVFCCSCLEYLLAFIMNSIRLKNCERINSKKKFSF